MTESGEDDCKKRRYTLHGHKSVTFVDKGYKGNHELRAISTDPADVGTHKVYLYIDFVNYEDINPIVRVKKIFNIVIDAECIRTKFTFKSIPTMNAMTLRSKVDHTWYENEQVDSVSKAAGINGNYADGFLSYCGRRTYKFIGLKYKAGEAKAGTAGPSAMTYSKTGISYRTLSLYSNSAS